MIERTDASPLKKTLSRRYVTMLAPAIIIFGAWAACRYAGLAPAPSASTIEILGPAIFIMAIVMAVALPLLYRASFVRKVEGQKNVQIGTFTTFQLNLTTLALIAPYMAAVGYVAGVSNYHFSGAFLASLYAAYYYYPSEKKITAETRLFRVVNTEE